MESGALLGIIVIALILVSLYGNCVLIISLIMSDASFLTYEANTLFVIVAAIVDIIVLCMIFSAKIQKPLFESARLACSGIRRIKTVHKNKKYAEDIVGKESVYLAQLQGLQSKNISSDSVNRADRLINLLIQIEGDEKAKQCYDQVLEKKKVLATIEELEHKFFRLAVFYKDCGDIKKSQFYYEIAKHSLSTDDQQRFNEAYATNQEQYNKERTAIKKWFVTAAMVVIIAVCVWAGIYTSNAPYRELSKMIEEQSLSAEMLDFSNRDSEDSYYRLLKCKKGYKYLADEFTRLHESDDIETALWLLCIQPDCIDGSDVCTSESFSKWILDYARENGIKSQTKGGRDQYTVGDYTITYYSDNIFHISDGENENTIEDRIDVAGADPVQVIE